VLLSTPLHVSSNFTVSVQLTNKRGFKKKKPASTAEVKNGGAVPPLLIHLCGFVLNKYRDNFTLYH
jgi:hypothetical protein